MNSPANPPAPFAWTDAYLLGYQPMDETHREFVEIVDAMLAADDADFAALLDRFVLHATDHFERERIWMEGSAFPATECHVDEHGAVMHSVEQVKAVVATGNVAEGRRLAAELAKWFPGHADYMDASLAQWMVKQSTGGKPIVLRRGVARHNEAEPS
jgi:hemerythrin